MYGCEKFRVSFFRVGGIFFFSNTRLKIFFFFFASTRCQNFILPEVRVFFNDVKISVLKKIILIMINNVRYWWLFRGIKSPKKWVALFFIVL